MARKPQVGWWESRGCFGTTIKGIQYRLGDGPDDRPFGPQHNAAIERYKQLLALGNADAAGADNTVRVVCERYLRHAERVVGAGTFRIRSMMLNDFCDAHGEDAVGSLKPSTVEDWLHGMAEPHERGPNGRKYTWCEGTQWLCLTSLQAAFNWAQEDGLIPCHPFAKVKGFDFRSRGAESLIGSTPEEREANHQRILAAARASFRPIIIILEATGCRPGEICNATAGHFNAREGTLVFQSKARAKKGEATHKTAKQDKVRIIVLTGESRSIVADAAKQYPIGPLFRRAPRSSQGRIGIAKPWTPATIVDRFRRISRKVGMPQLTAYSYRHTFATNWLEQRGEIEMLATIMGNTPAVIRKHYAHLLVDTDNLRRHIEAYQRATSGDSGGSPSAPRAFDPESDREAV